MGPLILRKLLYLLWKNFTLKRRKFLTLCIEIALTIISGASLLGIRNIVTIQKAEPLIYSPLPVKDVPIHITFPTTFPYPWELAYVPSKVDVVRQIVETVRRDLSLHLKVIGFSTERDFEDYVMKYPNYNKVLAAIVFQHDFKSSHDPLPLKVKYCLRFSNYMKNFETNYTSEEENWFTDSLFPAVLLGPRNPFDIDGGSPGYISEGFLYFQHALDNAIMIHHGGTAAETLLDNILVLTQRFPYPTRYLDAFAILASIFIPLLMACIFSMNHLTIVQAIVWEKENRLKEYQLMIGLSNWMLWAAYFFTFLCLYCINIIFMCIIFFLKIQPAPIFKYNDPIIVFVFLLCYAISSIFFSFMISTFFNNVNFAVGLGTLLFFITYIPSIKVSLGFGTLSFKQKLASCLSFNVVMALGFKFLLDAEQKKTGIQWRDIISPKNMDNFLFSYFLGMFLFDAFLYGLVAWYIDTVFPGKYGVPKPWNFFMMRSYWCGEKLEPHPQSIQNFEPMESKYFEAEPTNLYTGVQIKHLRKVFTKKNITKVAIEDLTLNLYEGQITVLLGHNGAGKSTTLSILSGLYPPTSGEAYVNGLEISQRMTEIRNFLGVCPQQNLLFDFLTVSEHLFFYSMVKGVSRENYLQEVNQMLATFNLLEKRDAFSLSLSGGMKRKLSIIIALIGGSKVVILDEPTSGMDPASRRATWDILQNYKNNRTVLLTTHHMDEADVLGDRIAIMVQGSLRCCGSSIFLKQRYGVGYHIVIVKAPNCDAEEISKLIRDYAATATLETNVETEISFILPKEYAHRFEDLFTALEKDKERLGIVSFGASVTTMEEVFLRVSQLENLGTENQDLQSSILTSTWRQGAYIQNENSTTVFNTGCSLYCQQLRAMIKKRFLYNWRNWKLLMVQILGLVFSTLFLFKPDSSTANEPIARSMNLDEYGSTFVPYSVSGSSNLTSSLITNLEKVINSDYHKLKKVPGRVQDYLMQTEETTDSCIVAFSIEVTGHITTLTAMFNNEAYHSPPLSLEILDNVLYMSLSGADASLTVSNKPQPMLPEAQHSEIVDGKVVALKLQLGMALLISGFCFLTVTERTTKAKQMQFLSGVSVIVYWLSALVCDLIIFFFSCFLLLAVFKFYKIDIYVMDYHILETLLILSLYGWCAIPFIYMMSFLFSKSTSAYVKLVIFNYVSGLICIVLDGTIEGDVPSNMSNSTKNFLRNALLVLPTYNFAKCISDYTIIYKRKIICNLYKNVSIGLNCSKSDTEKNIYSFKDRMIGKYLLAMTIAGFLFLLFIFLCENTLWKLKMFINQHIYFSIYKIYQKDIISKELSGESHEKDIEDERKKILEQPEKFMSSPVLIKQLIKIYFKCPVIMAVKNITLAIQTRECFGLLGYNGAGKTTTFQLLTGEKPPTSGDVFINGLSLSKDNTVVRSRVGYCPQYDTLLEYMTGQEIMVMYARVWGVSENQIQSYVATYLNSLELKSHANKLIYTYSGGNKRRLSTAIAMMGKPSIVFLDEPSTGMDPGVRRLLWDAVIKTRESGKAIIITSHSMEECEALCTRLAIMVKGKFMCLGSPQYLKNKFGNIYILKAKVLTEEALTDFKNFITMTFPGSELKQENQKILNYYIPSKDNSWGKVFGLLEKAKEQLNLEDYAISQANLEQVFLNFADPDDAESDAEQKVP